MSTMEQLPDLLEQVVTFVAHIRSFLVDCVQQLREVGELSPEQADRLLEMLCASKEAADVQDSAPTAVDSALMPVGGETSHFRHGPRQPRRGRGSHSGEGGHADSAN